MTEKLRIGEVARLLGITTKTIRHYHKVGLLAEPARSSSAYRLYSAHDLVCLIRIRRLQRWGLSLAQIHQILAQPTAQPLLRQALTEVVSALEEEIAQLQARRDAITTILQRDTLDVDQPETLPTILARIPTQLPPPDSPTVAAIWAQDQRIFGILESLSLPDGYRGEIAAMAEHTLSDPEIYHQMFMMAEQLVALADVPEGSPLVEALVVKARTEGWLTQLGDLMPAHTSADLPQSTLQEMLFSVLAPAQRRFLILIGEGNKTG